MENTMSNNYKNRAQDFTKRAKEEIGVSDEFLSSALPQIEELFRDVDGDLLKGATESILYILKLQADTEKTFENIKHDLEKFDKTEKDMQKSLTDLKRSAEDLKDSLSVLQACSRGKFGDA